MKNKLLITQVFKVVKIRCRIDESLINLRLFSVPLQPRRSGNMPALQYCSSPADCCKPDRFSDEWFDVSCVSV